MDSCCGSQVNCNSGRLGSTCWSKCPGSANTVSSKIRKVSPPPNRSASRRCSKVRSEERAGNYLLKESFQLLWHYKSPYWAQWYLKKWCTRAMRSRLKPIKRFVRSVRKHEPLILNWFRAKKAFSCGIVEGFNRNINLTIRKAGRPAFAQMLRSA